VQASDRETILLVEDDDDDATLFQLAVTRSACSGGVHRLRSTEEAINYVKAGLRPRLIFLDLLLADLPGTHFLRWLRDQEDFKCIPVIVLTGVVSTRTMKDLCALGVNAVMVKPSTVTLLEQAILAACTFWLKHCVPPRGSE
jgi:two-component system, chemotaxis family, response regulator Rcp1